MTALQDFRRLGASGGGRVASFACAAISIHWEIVRLSAFAAAAIRACNSFVTRTESTVSLRVFSIQCLRRMLTYAVILATFAYVRIGGQPQ